ncbi:transmembrane protein 45B-like [Haliotis asinina]|uniref:transmembrane protein 45B-like n=1 Tax=Haliotis asinina TaxID=109174 RepID=UPI0035323791
MVQIGLITASTYYALTAMWWLIQLTKHYHFMKQRHCDYFSSVTYHCCAWDKKHPVEGVFKVISSLAIAISLFSFSGATKVQFLTNREIATIFMFFMISGVMDILVRWSGRTFYQQLDYVALLLFFAIQSVVFVSRSQSSEQPLTMLYSLMLYTSLATLAATAMEMRYRDQVLCSVMRSYLLLTQGTWGLQVAFIVEDKSLMVNTDSDDILLTAMYFTWHCGINFFLVLSIWLIVFKMLQKQLCCCVAVDTAAGQDTIYLENRVHFDYHVLDRFESDVE